MKIISKSYAKGRFDEQRCILPRLNSYTLDTDHHQRVFMLEWEQNAEMASKDNRRFVKKLKKQSIDVQEQVDTIHDAVFAKINCLKCGNCCKTYHILLTEKDQERIGQYLEKDILEVLENYHLMDDGQILVQSLPCPFLGADNACLIYEVRPEVCRGYPFIKGIDIRENADRVAINTLRCPATYQILERLKAIV